MPFLPIGAILVGEILTLLMPALSIAALGVWYWRFTVRVPETPSFAEASPRPEDATPGPDVTQVLPADPAV